LDWSCFAEWRINRRKNDWITYDRQQNVTNVRRSLRTTVNEVLKRGLQKTSAIVHGENAREIKC